jgi:arylsulfatase A-like enzyme
MLRILRAPRAVLIALPLLLLACGGSGSGVRAAERKPDVLVLLIDTLRADRLGSYDYPRPTSPNLDALARRGAVLRRASAQAPWTIPSVSSLMTGRYLTSHQERPDPDATTLAELFKGAGYRTLGVCANHVIMPEVGFGRGFDEFIPRTYINDKGRRQKRIKGDFEAVLSWLDEPLQRATARDENGSRPPLFLYVQPLDPHAPYQLHSNYEDVLGQESVPPIQPEGWLERTLHEVGSVAPANDPGWKKALRAISRQRNQYDREVRYSDEVFGQLLETLEQRGVGDNLIVAVISDHGEELWEHLAPSTKVPRSELPPKVLFFQSHGYLLTEQALRTPFLLAGPGVPAGVRSNAPAENIDLLPTLLELCDIPLTFDPHGQSLVPFLTGEREASSLRELTFAYVQHGMMVREEASGLKLVLPTARGLELGFTPELFDLRADPIERTNLFGRRPADELRLTEHLQEYLRRYPSTEQALKGSEAEDLLDLLDELGYAGDMVRGPEGDDEE